MEEKAFKSVTFGGFDKQDVVNYLEKRSKENAAEVEQLQKERETLQSENAEIKTQLATLKARVEELEASSSRLQKEVDRVHAKDADLTALQAEKTRLTEQVAQLRPQAEAYVQFRDKVGDIECDARKRSSELESSTKAKLRQLTRDFRDRYQNLVTTFDATAGHVTGELRKVEVNLTQLPRALDQVGAELKELETSLGDREA